MLRIFWEVTKSAGPVPRHKVWTRVQNPGDRRALGAGQQPREDSWLPGYAVRACFCPLLRKSYYSRPVSSFFFFAESSMFSNRSAPIPGEGNREFLPFLNAMRGAARKINCQGWGFPTWALRSEDMCPPPSVYPCVEHGMTIYQCLLRRQLQLCARLNSLAFNSRAMPSAPWRIT